MLPESIELRKCPCPNCLSPMACEGREEMLTLDAHCDALKLLLSQVDANERELAEKRAFEQIFAVLEEER